MSNFWGAVQVSDGLLLKNKRNTNQKGRFKSALCCFPSNLYRITPNEPALPPLFALYPASTCSNNPYALTDIRV